MKEKKEMQIVVTADDSKAKTSLQKLADYLKKNFESGAKSAELDIDTVKSEIKLSKLQDRIKTMKDLLKNGNLNDEEFNSWATDIAKAEVEADKLRQTLANTDKEADSASKSINNLGNKVSSSLETASRKTRKFVLSLFSVRTAWAVISRASSSYLSQNEDTTNKVAAAWSYLGNILGPVIEKIVSWLQYGIAYVNVFVKALTGVDFLAKSIQKTTAKTNKELKKTVSSMDEIVNLDLDKGSNNGAANALQDIANLELDPKVVEFMEKLGKAVKEVWNWAKKAWGFLEEHFGTTGALAILAGLKLILGGKGTGLLGITGALKGLATIGTIAIGVDLLYGALTGRDLIQDLSDIKQGFEDLKEMSETNNKASKKTTKSWNEATSSFDYASMSADQLDQAIGMLSRDTDSTIEKSDRLTKQMEEMGSMYIDNRGAIKDTVDELNGNKLSLQRLKEQLLKNRNELEKGTEEYNRNEIAIRNVDKQLSLIDHKIVHAQLNVEISSNASTFRYNMYKLFDNIFDYWTDTLNRASGNGGKGSYGYGPGGGFRANGGFVDEGQMFIANERGPELIGTIGGSTAVVNNQQIVESVSQGVASAVAGVLTNQKSTSQSAQYLYIDGHEFAKATYDSFEEERNRRNRNTSIRRA